MLSNADGKYSNDNATYAFDKKILVADREREEGGRGNQKWFLQLPWSLMQNCHLETFSFLKPPPSNIVSLLYEFCFESSLDVSDFYKQIFLRSNDFLESTFTFLGNFSHNILKGMSKNFFSFDHFSKNVAANSFHKNYF